MYIIVGNCLYGCSTKTKITSQQVSYYDLKDTIPETVQAVAQTILPYKKELEKTMNEVLNSTDMAMEKDQPEGLLGNFVADLAYRIGNDKYVPMDDRKADFCLLNNGGLRTALPKGDITRGKIFELMPFENELVVITLSGEKTKELFDYVAKVGGAPVSGNVRIGMEEELSKMILVNNKPFNPAIAYKVITTDYLANGGDKMVFYDEPINRESVGIKLRDAILKYVAAEKVKGNSLSAKLDGRIYHVE